MGNLRRNHKSKEEMQALMEQRFRYLPKNERDKLVYGNEFVKVPTKELQRLRVDVYSYLM